MGINNFSEEDLAKLAELAKRIQVSLQELCELINSLTETPSLQDDEFLMNRELKIMDDERVCWRVPKEIRPRSRYTLLRRRMDRLLPVGHRYRGYEE